MEKGYSRGERRICFVVPHFLLVTKGGVPVYFKQFLDRGVKQLNLAFGRWFHITPSRLLAQNGDTLVPLCIVGNHVVLVY